MFGEIMEVLSHFSLNQDVILFKYSKLLNETFIEIDLRYHQLTNYFHSASLCPFVLPLTLMSTQAFSS